MTTIGDALLGNVTYDPGAAISQAQPGLVPQYPDDPLALADIGIKLRDDGVFDRAEEIFQSLIDRFPQFVYGFQEMGVLRSQIGRHDEALQFFRQALDVDPSDLMARKNLAFQLLRLGEANEAITILRAHPPGNSQMDFVAQTLAQFVDFVREHPEADALRLASRFERSGHYLSPREVADRIIAAAEVGEPFALIRLGDGEGAWLPRDNTDEARFAHLYEANRRGILKVWFASDALYNSRSFVALGRRLAEILPRTDVIGLPSSLRIAHEYRLLSIRGIPGSVDIMRGLAARLESAAPGSYCGQDIHLDLHINGFFRELLSTPFTFGVISCHPDLGYRLATSLGARVVRMIIVPEEKGFSQVAGVSGMSEPHYPLVFQRIVERLRREAQQATIWLIAAGYLGKVYCDEVREAGGIALDVGSVVDGWCGKLTRPTLPLMGNWEL
jgi:hypothetical protein